MLCCACSTNPRRWRRRLLSFWAACVGRGKRCLEIGAGTGILGLAAARLGAVVTITDYGELNELITHNIKRNLSPEQAARTKVIPLQYWLFAPELQWQSRGKWRILQGWAARTKVDSLDWNNPASMERFPADSCESFHQRTTARIRVYRRCIIPLVSEAHQWY
jgi:hypothetical protein